MIVNSDFWRKRRVLLTGHTGFKGAWMALLLEWLGAEVVGIALQPTTNPSLYEALSPWKSLISNICDIRDRQRLFNLISSIEPEIVIHMAAQPLVRDSYLSPAPTIEINVMGTVYLLEALRQATALAAALIVTTDKVYLNQNNTIPLSEDSPLGGTDPYSASKAAVEIITNAYAYSFFSGADIPICTARAGNVIGGGDWSKDRIIPDLWRAYISGKSIPLRYPNAIRPWQHVLEPLYGYLLYLEKTVVFPSEISRTLNFGPPIDSARTVSDIAKKFSEIFKSEQLYTLGTSDPKFHEHNYLSIDASQATRCLGWRSVLTTDQAILWTGEWYKAYHDGKDMRRFSQDQIVHYFDLIKANARQSQLKFFSKNQVGMRLER